MKARRLLVAAILLAGLHLSCGPTSGVGGAKKRPAVAAMQTSEWGHIVWFETGWADDTMAVMLDVPTVNPGCPTTNAGYALNPRDPGVKVHEAAIMGAYFSGRRVRIRAQGCAYDKPLIIAVAVTE